MNKDAFARVAESLRQYRRAELKEFQEDLGKNPIDALYVDPLPGDAILKSVLSSNTTFILGRKGTGKSTVFARAQSSLRDRQDVLSIYIDVKTLYEIVNGSEVPAKSAHSLEIDAGICRAHILRKVFLGKVISDLLKEIVSLCDTMSLWNRWLGKRRSFHELRTDLEALQSRLERTTLDEQELPILKQITHRWRLQKQNEHVGKSTASVDAAGGTAGFKVAGHASASDLDKSLDDAVVYNEYSDAVLKSFPFNKIIDEIKDLLSECDLKRVVVFFDDFSELGFMDQRLFVDVVLSPPNNSSNETVKLKVAGYRGRVYFGKIDATKVDIINLDFSALYEDIDVQSMERSAIDYATRLLKTRFAAFGEDVDSYFDSTPFEQHMRLIFETTFNVPRLIGALLHTCFLDRVSKGQPITPQAMRLAARKYYETILYQYFDRMNRFALEPFENKLDRHNQRQLLECVVREARNVRNRINDGSVGGTYFKGVRNPPTSHFIVSKGMGQIFDSLESNFLVSRYKDTRDKNGRDVTVYALYYGLTEAERLSWGYPTGREYRNDFVQRCFDYTAPIYDFLARKQTIRCAECGACFPLEQRASIELYKWRCPGCDVGVCAVVNLADDFEREVQLSRSELMLEGVELQILETLNAEDGPMRAGEISALIDTTYQLVGRRTSKLQDRGFVMKRPSRADGAMRSQITPRAERIYFGTGQGEE